MTDKDIIYYHEHDIHTIDTQHDPNEHYHNTTNTEEAGMDYIFLNILFNLLVCGVFIQLGKNCYDKMKSYQNDRNIVIYNQRLINPPVLSYDIVEVNDYDHVKIIIKHDFDNDLCSICLDNLYTEKEEEAEESTNDIIQINCNHMFHKKCLDPWILLNNNCPLCKSIV